MIHAIKQQNFENENYDQKFTLLTGRFSPYQSNYVVKPLIQKSIDGLKFHQISNWEKDHNQGLDIHQTKISELEGIKEQLDKLISEARMRGMDIEVRSTIEIRFI